MCPLARTRKPPHPYRPGRMSDMRRLLALPAAVALALGPALPAWAGTDVPGDTEEPGEGPNYPRGGEAPEGSEIAFEFQDPLISESGGIAPSLRHEGVGWTQHARDR